MLPLPRPKTNRIPYWKTALKGFFLSVIAGGGIFACAEVAVWAYPPVFALGWGLVERNAVCSLAEVFQGARQHYHQQRIADSTRKSCRLIEKDAGGHSLWETPLGRFWVPAGSEQVLPVLVAQQQMDIYGQPGRGVRPGDAVLDCGAHVGVFTRKALDGGAKLVVAIEPAPVNVECLRRNFIQEISQGRVIVVPKGVWNEEAVLPLFENPANTAADSFAMRGTNHKLARQIPLTTIDKLAAALRLERVDLVKMDIKGAASKALLGAKGVLARCHPRLVISTEERDDDPSGLMETLRQSGLSYRASCGACSLNAKQQLDPDVMFFH